jgi:hypothetical protein
MHINRESVNYLLVALFLSAKACLHHLHGGYVLQYLWCCSRGGGKEGEWIGLQGRKRTLAAVLRLRLAREKSFLSNLFLP